MGAGQRRVTALLPEAGTAGEHGAITPNTLLSRTGQRSLARSGDYRRNGGAGGCGMRAVDGVADQAGSSASKEHGRDTDRDCAATAGPCGRDVHPSGRLALPRAARTISRRPRILSRP